MAGGCVKPARSECDARVRAQRRESELLSHEFSQNRSDLGQSLGLGGSVAFSRIPVARGGDCREYGFRTASIAALPFALESSETEIFLPAELPREYWEIRP